MGEWKQNFYRIINKEKYVGTKPPFYRSSWEQRFMFWCDNNPSVLKWSSENIRIPYFFNDKTHIYIPDFYAEIKNKKGEVKKYIIEVKPYNQGPIKEGNKDVYIPKKPKNNNGKALKRYYMECQTYNKNTLKWKAAQQVCLKNGWQFIIVTRKDIFNL